MNSFGQTMRQTFYMLQHLQFCTQIALGVELLRNTPLKVIFAKKTSQCYYSIKDWLFWRSCLHPLTEISFLKEHELSNQISIFLFLALYRATSCSTKSHFLFQTELLLALKQNPKVDIHQSLHSGPNIIKFLIKMILLEAAGFVAKILVTNVLCIVTGLTKSMGS